MSESSEGLKQRIESDMKTAMRARDKERLGTIRLIMAAVKQRRDSITQFEQATHRGCAAL